MASTAREIEPPAKGMKEEQAEPPLFFDSFPKDILENVLRYFSRIPNAKTWETHIDVGDLVEAIGVDGGFGTLLKSRFHTLVVSYNKNCPYETETSGWKGPIGPYLWTKDIHAAHAFVLAGGGDSLRTLVLSEYMYSRERDVENFIDDFVNHCPNVTSLSIANEYSTVWTKKFASQLETLEVSGRIPISIADQAPVLRELNMRKYYDQRDILRLIGGSLKKLNIQEFMDGGYDDFEEFKVHCPNLTSLSLRGRSSGAKGAITRLLASYGDKLEYARLYDFSEDHIADVATACPNARFGVHDHQLSLSSLNLIGPRLENLNVLRTVSVGVGPNLDEWTNAWNRCVNLQHLEIEPHNFGDIQAVFSTPKNHLVSIELTLSSRSFGREEVKKMMENCAYGTKSVEKFTCRVSGRFIDLFDGFVEKNRATLRFIELDFYFDDGNEKHEKLLQTFIKLPALEELFINKNIPEHIVTGLHKNGVYWSHCNY